jgi:hypothetical protein
MPFLWLICKQEVLYHSQPRIISLYDVRKKGSASIQPITELGHSPTYLLVSKASKQGLNSLYLPLIKLRISRELFTSLCEVQQTRLSLDSPISELSSSPNYLPV